MSTRDRVRPDRLVVSSPLPQNLPHSPPLGQLIHQLVEIADLAHPRFLDDLDPHAADRAGDRRGGRVERRGLAKDLFEGRARAQLGLQRRRVIAGEPADHLVELGASAALFLQLGEGERIGAGEASLEDAVRRDGGVLRAGAVFRTLRALRPDEGTPPPCKSMVPLAPARPLRVPRSGEELPYREPFPRPSVLQVATLAPPLRGIPCVPL